MAYQSCQNIVPLRRLHDEGYVHNRNEQQGKFHMHCPKYLGNIMIIYIYIFLYIYLYIYIYLSTYLPTYLPIYPSIHLSIYPSIYLSTYLRSFLYAINHCYHTGHHKVTTCLERFQFIFFCC